MPTPTRPTTGTLIVWGGTQVQPSTGEAATGYAQDFVPPAEWHNFKFGNIYLWLTWFDYITNPSSLQLSKTANFTMAYPTRSYLCDPTAGSFTGTFPLANTLFPGARFMVKNIAIGSGNVVNLAISGSDQVENQSTDVLAAGEFRTYETDGVSKFWQVG